MALITDLPSNASPSTSDYMITDTGSATQKCTIANLKKTMGFDSGVTVITKAATAGNSATYSVSNNTRGLLIINGTTAGVKGLYIFNCSNTGTITLATVLAASSTTITNSTNSLSASSSSAAISMTLIVTAGTVS